MERNLTEGSISRNIIEFSLPYLLSYFLQTLYGMADLYIIGQYEGAAGTSAVSIGSQVMQLITSIVVGLAMGTTVSVGQSAGAGNRRRTFRYIGNTITLFAVLAGVMTIGLLAAASEITGLMSTPPEAVAGTATYLRICIAGIPFITAYNIISAVFRGLGDSRSPMYFIAVACAANIGLDYLFIGGLGLGPAGAALGTVLAQTISVCIALAVVMRGLRKGAGNHRACTGGIGADDSIYGFTAADLIPDREAIGRLLRVGIPVACQDGFITIGFLIITVIANRRGLIAAAAVGIVEKIISFIFLVPSSMMSTVSAVGAQCIGAGKPGRTDRTLMYTVIVSVSYGFIMTVIIQLMAEGVVGLFTTDAAAVAAGGQYFRGYIIDALFAGIHFCFSGYFCAREKSWLSFFHNILSLVLFRVPGAYLASVIFPETLLPMGLATAAGSLFSSLVCAAAFVVIKRKDRAIVS